MTETSAAGSTPVSARDGASTTDVGNPASFETAMSELETLVHAMEGGNLSLEQSLEAYKRGATLVAACRQSLTDARQQVRILEGELLKVFEVESAGPQGEDD